MAAVSTNVGSQHVILVHNRRKVYTVVSLPYLKKRRKLPWGWNYPYNNEVPTGYTFVKPKF